MTVTTSDEIHKDVCPYHYFCFSHKLIMDIFNVVFVSVSNKSKNIRYFRFFCNTFIVLVRKLQFCLLKSSSTSKNKAD